MQGFYATVVRPKAEAIRIHDAAQMQKDPNYVPERDLYVIAKDYEQEVCFILTFWALAIMGYKAWSLRRGAQLTRVGDRARRGCPSRAAPRGS